jgi:PIN domain nuclease of toxin-antitoxin system
LNILLDTHMILWWLNNDPLLPEFSKNLISDSNTICFVSSASIWEISIKSALGKLEIPDDYLAELRDEGFLELPIRWEHARMVKELPLHHHDPFDRILIAQSNREKLFLVTVDDEIKQYQEQLYRLQ